MSGRKSPKLPVALGVLAIAAVAAPAAQALEPGLYFELSLGKSKFKDVDIAGLDGLTANFFESYDLFVTSLDSTLDTKDRSYSITTGYRLNRYLAGEVSYYRLGAFQYSTQGTVDDAGVTRPATFWFGYRTKGVAIGGAATLPLGPVFELRARGGISNTDTRIKYTATVEDSEATEKASDSSQDFYYGAGVGMNFWTYYRIGVDWLQWKDMGKASTTGSTSVDSLMFSFAYQY